MKSGPVLFSMSLLWVRVGFTFKISIHLKVEQLVLLFALRDRRYYKTLQDYFFLDVKSCCQNVQLDA